MPSAPEWLHEVKYDGFRLLVHREGDRVRLITRGGHDWTKRYPWIVEAALKKRSDRPHRGGRSKDWIKVKNRTHPAMERVMEAFK